jgi:hypothetical protein
MDRNCESPSPSRPEYEQPEAQPAPAPCVEQHLLSEETAQLIRRKAHRLIAQASMPASDVHEVVQALHAILVQAGKLFDPKLGSWLAFAERSLQYAANNWKRQRYTESRHPHRCISLSIQVKVPGEGDVSELAQLVTAADQDARTGGRTIDQVELADLRMDLAEFLATLPPLLRDLAEALGSETILNISRRTGVPRSTIYDRLAQMRELAEDAGLGKYLK